MYPWVTHTWNPIKGKCPHDCSYCYMKRFPQKELHFDEKELLTDLGKGNTIFVGSSCDIFADEIPHEWIQKSMIHCFNFDNTYLFQTKNLYKLNQYCLPEKRIVGTTIESNRDYHVSKAVPPEARYKWLRALFCKKMVSIEPIMDFDVDVLSNWIIEIKPDFVSIGADSKGHNLPEPNSEKILTFIDELKQFTEAKIKDNLKRLLHK